MVGIPEAGEPPDAPADSHLSGHRLERPRPAGSPGSAPGSGAGRRGAVAFWAVGFFFLLSPLPYLGMFFFVLFPFLFSFWALRFLLGFGGRSGWSCFLGGRGGVGSSRDGATYPSEGFVASLKAS